jgi:hypothetical protein
LTRVRPTTPYQQLARQLREQIESGKIASQLPSIGKNMFDLRRGAVVHNLLSRANPMPAATSAQPDDYMIGALAV